MVGAGVEPPAWPLPQASLVDRQISNSGNELQPLPVIDLLSTASFCLPSLVQIPPLAHTDLKVCKKQNSGKHGFSSAKLTHPDRVSSFNSTYLPNEDNCKTMFQPNVMQLFLVQQKTL